MSGGQIEWQALDILADLVGIEDREEMIRDLIIIRDNLQKAAQSGRP